MAQLKLSNIMNGFVIVAILVGCLVGMYRGFESEYSFTRADTVGGLTIMEQIDGLLIVESMNRAVAGIYDIINPSNPLDVIGGLLSAGYGLATGILGTLTLPAEIINIIGQHYGDFIPPIVLNSIIVLFYISSAFIIFNLITRSDN